jgi:hypothetical protein
VASATDVLAHLAEQDANGDHPRKCDKDRGLTDQANNAFQHTCGERSAKSGIVNDHYKGRHDETCKISSVGAACSLITLRLRGQAHTPREMCSLCLRLVSAMCAIKL